jgi:hypothetical protein
VEVAKIGIRCASLRQPFRSHTCSPKRRTGVHDAEQSALLHNRPPPEGGVSFQGTPMASRMNRFILALAVAQLSACASLIARDDCGGGVSTGTGPRCETTVMTDATQRPAPARGRGPVPDTIASVPTDHAPR